MRSERPDWDAEAKDEIYRCSERGHDVDWYERRVRNAKEIEDDWWFEELMYECLFYTSHVRPWAMCLEKKHDEKMHAPCHTLHFLFHFSLRFIIYCCVCADRSACQDMETAVSLNGKSKMVQTQLLCRWRARTLLSFPHRIIQYFSPLATTSCARDPEQYNNIHIHLWIYHTPHSEPLFLALWNMGQASEE